MGDHVTGTCAGRGARATRTRRTVPRAGTLDRYGSPGASLSPPACRGGGGAGWRHTGAVGASPGGHPAGPAGAAAGAAVPPPADPTGAHPQGPGPDTADWDVGVRGPRGPRRRARGTRSHLRAGLVRLLVGVSAWAQCPRRRAHPGADGAPGRGAVERRGSQRILLRQRGSPRVKAAARSAGCRWGAGAAPGPRRARGGTRRRGGGGARGGDRPGGGARTVLGHRRCARGARPRVCNRGAATATGASHPDPLL